MVERILRWLAWALAFLFLVSVVLEGSGVKPLQRWLPGQLSAPILFAIALLVVLVSRAENIESKVSEALKALGTAQEGLKRTLEQVDAGGAKAKELAAELQQLRARIAHSDLLLPGRLALMQKRFDEAAELLEEVVERSPDNQEARWLFGVALFRSRKAREALPHLQQALSNSDPDQLQLIAQCEHFLGHHQDAETHALRAVALTKPTSQDAIALLGSIQGELDPERARVTLREALVVYPRNSPIRYELIKIEIDTGNYDAAVEVASEGYRLNERDAGCLVGRAEARLRRGRAEDEADVLKDLEQAEKIHRRDANLYRLRGELWLRRANRTEDPGDRERMLKEALTAYDAGIANIRAGWLQASLLSSKSRVLLLLQDYDGAAAAAKAAVETAPGHVGNHIALALARLAAAKWQPAVLAADAGQNVGGWAGRIILAAVRIIGLAMAGVEPQDLSPNCKVLADEFEHSVGKFTPQETWTVVREAVSKKVAALGGSGAQLITDTIRLLEGQTSASEFRGKWAA